MLYLLIDLFQYLYFQFDVGVDVRRFLLMIFFLFYVELEFWYIEIHLKFILFEIVRSNIYFINSSSTCNFSSIT